MHAHLSYMQISEAAANAQASILPFPANIKVVQDIDEALLLLETEIRKEMPTSKRKLRAFS